MKKNYILDKKKNLIIKINIKNNYIAITIRKIYYK